jgi:hypothetical protein
MNIFIGVDHGASGALAALTEDGKIHNILKMPYRDGKIDCFQVYSWLYENYGDYEHEVTSCGEKLNAIFRAAASTTFSFGKNVGKIVGIIECLEMNYLEVRAVDWQKYIFNKFSIEESYSTKKTPSGKLRKDTKGMALLAATKIWGDEILPYAKHDGLIDALLIAYYAMENNKH